ncbi:hypothetical protein CLF_109796 [Clonorchis sinensis]|uniref:Uncharacterized protein n=1 Tax=Clonorchis sinensis TaxID=79923 RepID=G7YJT9_CLOSI|nr:hypothetical protein CLF_109796 [Clonorchis sinensis]
MTLSGHRKDGLVAAIPEEENSLTGIMEQLRAPSAKAMKLLVRDYSGRHPTWIPGLILRQRSKMPHEIQVGSARWIRHANQIRLTDAQILPTGPKNPSAASSEGQPEQSTTATLDRQDMQADLRCKLQESQKKKVSLAGTVYRRRIMNSITMKCSRHLSVMRSRYTNAYMRIHIGTLISMAIGNYYARLHNSDASERQSLNDKNKTDPGDLGESLAPVYQSVNP